MRGIDTDNYDGEISIQRFLTLHDDFDMRFNIIGLEAGMPFAESQMNNSIAAGLTVGNGYKFLYWADNDLDRLDKASDFGIPVWIDAEWQKGMAQGVESTVDRLLAARELLGSKGMYAGIYTGEWWWVPYTGNSQQFSSDPLWHAGYPFGNKLPPLDFVPDRTTFRSYGGWTVPTVWQYAATCYGEKGFDMNYFWEEGE